MDAVAERGGLPSFLAAVLTRCEEDGARPDLILSEAIATIDRRVRAQVDEILKAPKFRRLEAAWNALEYLVSEKPADPLVKVRVLNASKEEIQYDLEDAIEFDRSALFQLVYENEFGQFGGTPYAILVGDYEYADSPEEIETLEGLAGIASAAHAVLFVGAAPDLLGLDHWGKLSAQAIPEEHPNPAWRALRSRPDTRYLGLVLPHVLLRAPHRPGQPHRTLGLREDSFAADGSGMLWGNAAYALATRVMHAFEEYGWCTAIRGLEEEHGLVDGLPEIESPLDRPGVVRVPPVDFAITESCEVGLTDLGLIPLCRVAATERVAFFNVPSLHQPMVVDDPKINTNLKLSAQVPYVLAASRIAHYLKVMMRDRVGKFAHAGEIQTELSNWLARYTLNDDHASRERQSQFPLRAFDVQVREKPGRPGQLEAITQLQPHYQIEAPGVMLRLAVDLPDPEKTRR